MEELQNKLFTIVVDYYEDDEPKQLIREIYSTRGMFALQEAQTKLFPLYNISDNFKIKVEEKDEHK